MRRTTVRRVFACLVAMGVAASVGLGLTGSLAFAAQPRVESQAQFLRRGDGICKIATRDLRKATPKPASGSVTTTQQLVHETRAIGRVLFWEFRAFKRLPGTPAAVESGYKYDDEAYQLAGQLIMTAAGMFQDGFLGGGRSKLNLGFRAQADGDKWMAQLGMRACAEE